MNKLLSVLLCISIIILTGCWDSVPIESRAYIIGVAIDEYLPIPQVAETETESPNSIQEERFETAIDIHSGDPSSP